MPEKIYWRCARQGCGVWVHTRYLNVDAENPDIVILKPPGDHAHAAEEDLVATTAVKERMLNLVAADPTQPVKPKRVYDQVVAQAPRGQHLPTWDSVKTRLERRRASHMPPIPRTVQEVDVQGEWAATWGGDQFLSKNNRQHGYLVFTTDDNLDKLCHCDQVRTLSHKTPC